MSANVYNVQSLLIGKEYISRTMRGEIISAEPHPKAVWYEGCDTYLVEVAPNSGYNNFGRSTYRTVAVKVGE
jgi:beta-phosphoglucomutase-like phosphatase (HAD superfamily)